MVVRKDGAGIEDTLSRWQRFLDWLRGLWRKERP